MRAVAEVRNLNEPLAKAGALELLRPDARALSLKPPMIVDESLSWARSRVDRRRTLRVGPLRKPPIGAGA